MLKFNVTTELDKKILLERAKNVLWKAMNKIEELAKVYVPVDTGRLKNSLHLDPTNPGQVEYICTDATEYGVFQEYGTMKMDAQPFLRPAGDIVQVHWLPIFWEQELAKK